MKVLITAGPTWVKIDQVRIITNIFTGRTGLYLAKEFRKKGCQVSLLINPHCIRKLPSDIRIREFRYFEELKSIIEQELETRRYDVIIHSAAVSDYKLKREFRGKIPSGKPCITLRLRPTPKLIKIMRKLAKDSFLVQFKLEVEREQLIEKACRSLKNSNADLVIANSFNDLKLRYIIDKNRNVKKVNSLKELFLSILEIVSSFMPGHKI